jgi:hypothetical protein
MPIAVVCVPLLGLHYSVHRSYVRIAAAILTLAVVVALGAYGQSIGGVAFGLVVAVHAVGIAAYLDLESPADSFGYRMARSFVLVAVVALILPLIAARALDSVVIPVVGPTEVLLINSFSGVRSLQPGEMVAYELAVARERGLRIEPGLYLGQVLAGPRAEIEFANGVYRLNGVEHPALLHMPASGKVTVGAGQNFIWPAVFLANYVGLNGSVFPAASALVADSALVGRPYKRWFWRTQTS